MTHLNRDVELWTTVHYTGRMGQKNVEAKKLKNLITVDKILYNVRQNTIIHDPRLPPLQTLVHKVRSLVHLWD